MRLTTKTEYGLVCLIYMARHSAKSVITVKEIAANERFSLTYLQQIFHHLGEAGIVRPHHGRQGGYSLARDPSVISLREIVEALEGQTFEIFCVPEIRKEIVCTHFDMCGVKPVWARTKTLLDQFFSSISLEALAREERDVKTHLAAMPVPDMGRAGR